jgi:HSP20 family protein
MAGALTHWDPFSELADLRSRFFDRAFDDFDSRDRAWAPAIDVVRKDGNVVVHADIPGIKPDEVKVQLANDVLTITGEHEEGKEEKSQQYVRRERR